MTEHRIGEGPIRLGPFCQYHVLEGLEKESAMRKKLPTLHYGQRRSLSPLDQGGLRLRSISIKKDYYGCFNSNRGSSRRKVTRKNLGVSAASSSGGCRGGGPSRVERGIRHGEGQAPAQEEGAGEDGAGKDGVPSKVLALAMGYLEERFRSLLNLSIASGRFPSR
ncbi:hypothetical protein ACJJTC_000612 [Scirpophaga incertulas]